MNKKEEFKRILKSKGTGKTMSKHMTASDIAFVTHYLNSPDIPMAMKSTLLTAWLMLDATPEEAAGLQHIKDTMASTLPPDLRFLFDPPLTFFDTQLHSIFKFRNIDQHSLNQCLQLISNNEIPDWKVSSFFESLRLKEETFEENQCVYDFYCRSSLWTTLDLPLIIDMATAYDGFSRHYFLQPFIAALLGSIGIRCILHGVNESSPKNGMNTHKILIKAEKNPLKSLDCVADDILNPAIGWGYIDQSISNPTLHRLMPIRLAMVKRPVLATIEKWLSPVRAERTVCLTGFTHPGYKQKTIDLIQKTPIYSDLILVRGVEGSTLLPSDRRSPLITGHSGVESSFDFISPETFGYQSMTMASQNPMDSLKIGIQALRGSHKKLTQYLMYQCLAIGNVIGHNIPQMKSALEKSIYTGKAIEHWNRY